MRFVGVRTAVLVGVAVIFLPIMVWAFAERWFFPDLWPARWGLRAWRYVLTTSGGQVFSALQHSLATALATAGLSVLTGFPAGRALGLYHFRAKPLVTLVLITPLIVPPLATAMGLHGWFLRLGLGESFYGVVLTHLTVCLPYAVLVLWGVFANYNPAFEEQARTLGASRRAVWFRVILPFTLPGAVVALLFSFLLSWSQYLTTLIIGGGRLITLPMLLFALMGSGDRPVAAVVSLVFIAPVVAIFFVSARFTGQKAMAGVWQ